MDGSKKHFPKTLGIVLISLLIIILWGIILYITGVFHFGKNIVSATNVPAEDVSASTSSDSILSESSELSFFLQDYSLWDLSSVINILSTTGFTNIVYVDYKNEAITNIHGYIVYEQDHKAGENISYDDILILKCVPLQYYLDVEVIGHPINEIKQTLLNLHFTDITYIDVKTGKDITYSIETLTEEEYDNWSVVGTTNIDSSSVVKSIVIQVQRVLKDYQLFLDLAFENNPTNLKQESVELSLISNDDNSVVFIETLPYGKPFSVLLPIPEGSYYLRFETKDTKIENTTAPFLLSSDLTFSCSITVKSSRIEIENEKTDSSLEGSSLTMPQLLGKTLILANQELANIGFINIEAVKETGGAPDSLFTWVVIQQNIPEGESKTKADLIILTCKRSDDYLKQFVDCSLLETKTILEEMGYTAISYKLTVFNDITDEILHADSDILADYLITSTATTNNKITIFLRRVEQ